MCSSAEQQQCYVVFSFEFPSDDTLWCWIILLTSNSDVVSRKQHITASRSPVILLLAPYTCLYWVSRIPSLTNHSFSWKLLSVYSHWGVISQPWKDWHHLREFTNYFLFGIFHKKYFLCIISMFDCLFLSKILVHIKRTKYFPSMNF